LGAISKVFEGNHRRFFPFETETATWFKKGHLVLIGGRSEAEQRRFADSAMRELTIEKKVPTAYFSPFIAKEELSLELLTYMSGVRGIGCINSTRSDWSRIATSAGVLAECPLYVHDATLIEVAKIRDAISDIAKLEGLDIELVLVDYVQLLRGRSGPMARPEEVMQTVGYLKSLARDLNITIAAMTQASRFQRKLCVFDPYSKGIKKLADAVICA
jgi:replicative DNA helicase